jgi:hypothetical protein
LTRTLALLALLAGCSVSPPQPPQFPACPGSVPVPAALRKGESVGKLEIRVEIGREAERARGDACAASSDAMRKWIGK